MIKFPSTEFSFDRIVNHVRQQAYLVKSTQITVIDAREYTGKIDFDNIYYFADSGIEAISRTFYFEGGLRSLVAFYNQIQKPVHSNIFM
jgi:DNA gyrase/topoisomerase IV subunit B